MHYPAWKYILIVVVLVISGIYALPNLYPDEPAVQITGTSAGTQLSSDVLGQSQGILDKAGLTHHGGNFENNSVLIRLKNAEDQLKAQEALRKNLGDNYVVALNLAQTTPDWLKNIGAKPMKLGLDLRGGVRFVLEVDMAKALEQRLTTASQEIRRTLRSEKITTKGLRNTDNGMVLTFNSNQSISHTKFIDTVTQCGQVLTNSIIIDGSQCCFGVSEFKCRSVFAHQRA